MADNDSARTAHARETSRFTQAEMQDMRDRNNDAPAVSKEAADSLLDRLGGLLRRREAAEPDAA